MKVPSILSERPINLKRITERDADKEKLRAGVIAELDAINLYEQMAAVTGNEHKITLCALGEMRAGMEHFT